MPNTLAILIKSDFIPLTRNIGIDRTGLVHGDLAEAQGDTRSWVIDPSSDSLKIETAGAGAMTDSHGNTYFSAPSYQGKKGLYLLVRATGGAVTEIASGPGMNGSSPMEPLTAIRGMTLDQDDRLYVIDGRRLHSFKEGEQLQTICEDVLANEVALLNPRLLGLAWRGGKIYVADYDCRCLREVVGKMEQCSVTRVCSSGRLWSPVGICGWRDNELLVMEHRSMTVSGRLLRCFWSWIRVRSVDVVDRANTRTIATIGWWTLLSRLLKNSGKQR